MRQASVRGPTLQEPIDQGPQRRAHAVAPPDEAQRQRPTETQEVRDLLVRREGDRALVTFDMAGEAELETGETLGVFKHFTLVWIDTGDGWRIMHEHISDGQPARQAER